MKHPNLRLAPVLVSFLSLSLFFSSCSSDDDNSGPDTPTVTPTDIPSDDKAISNPIIIDGEENAILPNAQFSLTGSNNEITINMTGIQDPATAEWIQLFGTALETQNVWVEVDDKPKGIVVLNKSADKEKKVSVDLVFTVDNSDSMWQEADAVANGIVDWATKLSNKNLDIKFGCVGFGFYYDDNSCGGINMTDLAGISGFLNRSGITGIERTVGFVGADSLQLKEASKNYKQAHDECGAEAIRFADAQYNFRKGASRVYVNFTDEPNQPRPGNGSTYFDAVKSISVDWFSKQDQWNTSQGTIHTVYSAGNFPNEPGVNEHPWLMSEYTGGTVKFVNSSFSGVTLDDLPITDALSNSYVIRFIDNSSVTDGSHKVKITVLTEDGNVKVSRTFTDVTFGK